MGSSASKETSPSSKSSSSTSSSSITKDESTITRVEPPPKYVPPEGTEIQTFEPPQIEIDEEGFVKSFDITDSEGYIDFFNKYGFVVVNNVLSKAEVDASVDEIWTEVEALSRDDEPIFRTPAMAGKKEEGMSMISLGGGSKKTTSEASSSSSTSSSSSASSAKSEGVCRDDPNTWDTNWPGGRLGIMGNDIAASPMAWRNRISPNLYKVYSDLLGTKELIASLDRYGIMRPTKNIKFPVLDAKGKPTNEFKVCDKPEWLTQSQWWHWDLAVWSWYGLDPGEKDLAVVEPPIDWSNMIQAAFSFITENNAKSDFQGFDKLQGLVSFSNSKENGGFITVPGYHNYLETWARQTPQISRAGFLPCDKKNPLCNQGLKITMRKGSLVVWSSRMPHCNYPNEGSEFRMCQYIKMFPAAVVDAKTMPARADAIRARLPAEVEVTELGEKLFGFKPWSEARKGEEDSPQPDDKGKQVDQEARPE